MKNKPSSLWYLTALIPIIGFIVALSFLKKRDNEMAWKLVKYSTIVYMIFLIIVPIIAGMLAYWATSFVQSQ